MTRMPADEARVRPDDSERGSTRDGARPGPAGRARGSSRRWRRPVADVLAVGLATGVLLVLGWIRVDDLAAQLLTQLVVVAGAAAVARSRSSL